MEIPLTDLAVYSARPTIQIDTQEHAKVSELLIGLEMQESEGGLSSAELRFSNVASLPQGASDYAFESDPIMKLGSRVTIHAGDENAPTEIFQGIVTGLEADFPELAPPELVVLAEDVLQLGRMQRRTKVYSDVSLSDIASEIANELGLSPIISGYDDNIGTWAQLNESDLAFLRRILRRFDGDVQVVGDELHVSPRADIRRGLQTLELYSQLRQLRCLVDIADQVTKMTVTGWDALNGERVTGDSSGANLGAGEGLAGSDELRYAIGKRHHHLSHLAVGTQREAQAIADAAYDQRARRFVRVEGRAEGNPALRVGAEVELLGLGPRFENTYYVTEACHRWDVENGYETDFKAECAYWSG